MTDRIKDIKSTTNQFRVQKDDLLIGIGKELVKKGFDIRKVIIADMFTEDVSKWYVVIVTPNKGVYEFYYDHLHKKPSEGAIVKWHDFY